MTYSKPELLATEAAIDAIRGQKGIQPVPDGDQVLVYTPDPAYEVDE